RISPSVDEKLAIDVPTHAHRSLKTRVDRSVGSSRRARALNALYRRLLKPRTFTAFDVSQARRTVALLDRVLGGTGVGVARSAVDVSGISSEWIAAGDSRPTRTILYLHGGAFLFRTPRTHARLAARLARLLDARALMPDYRLAPEHPLPAAHED